MDEDIEMFIKEVLNINIKQNYLFKEVYGLTFVFKESFVTLQEMLSSCEIKPMGIIYSQDEEIYYAPLNERGDIEEIVKEYCR